MNVNDILDDEESRKRRFRARFLWIMWILHIDQQKADWFESDFCVSTALKHPNTIEIDNGPFLP